MDIALEKQNDNKFVIKKDPSRGMNTDVVVYADDTLMGYMKKDNTLQQAVNATTLPGLAGNVLVMPDGHEGYGFPVGGVAAFDSDNGIISPGAIGFDINCGIKVIKTNLTEKDIKPKLKQLADMLFKNVPSGVGSRVNWGFSDTDMRRIAEEGVPYIVSKGFGIADDIECIEENGAMAGADYDKVSKEAKTRGIRELGTLGAGNHFLEVQKVERIFDEEKAKAYGLEKGQVVVMVHCGSRGFGHQIASDYLMLLNEYRARHGISLVDKELSYAFVHDKEATDYLAAMKSAVNFAFVNREIIAHSIRKSFEETFGKSADAMGMLTLYDVAHNIAKLEEHRIEGKLRKVYVHRKGATRAFPKGMQEVPKIYRGIGQPVLIPGSMGTASYILCGMPGSMEQSYGTTCHGSGRVMSRHQAVREIPTSKTLDSLKSKGIELRVKSRNLISEEAEWAYKDVDEVVGVVEKAGLSKIVARNVPILVVKG
ncbi:MAG: RtcB family protein [Candidatus Micrarchaeia archaeon]